MACDEIGKNLIVDSVRIIADVTFKCNALMNKRIALQFKLLPSLESVQFNELLMSSTKNCVGNNRP